MAGILGITASGVDTTTTVHTLSADDIILPSIVLSEPQLVENTLDLDIAVIRATVTTSGATQDFTSTSFGTPKGAWFIASTDQSDSQDTDAGTGSHPGFAMGFCDGTSQRIWSLKAEDNTTATAIRMQYRNDACGGVLEYSTTSGIDFLDFNSWITDGVRLNKATISRAFLMTVVLFKGDDFDMACGLTNMDNTVSGLSFKPNVILGLSNFTSQQNQDLAFAQCSIGMAWDTGSGTVEHSRGFAPINGANPSSTNSRYDTNSWVRNHGASSPEANITAWNSDGFTTDIPDPYGFEDVYFCAMRFGGGVWMGTQTTPTAPGAHSKTGLAFQPGFLFSICMNVAATDTTYYNGVCFPSHLTVTDGTNTYAHCWGLEDGVSPNTVWTAAAQSSALAYDDSGTVKQHEASLTSFNSDGWTENFTTAPGSAQYMLRLAVET